MRAQIQHELKNTVLDENEKQELRDLLYRIR